MMSPNTLPSTSMHALAEPPEGAVNGETRGRSSGEFEQAWESKMKPNVDKNMAL
jgi:hypothetical protein